MYVCLLKYLCCQKPLNSFHCHLISANYTKSGSSRRKIVTKPCLRKHNLRIHNFLTFLKSTKRTLGNVTDYIFIFITDWIHGLKVIFLYMD